MQDHRTQLATLIASRICHDLISPVGAISNGLELVQLSGGMGDGPELTLISDSCDNAGARIRFFRVAYGAANDAAMVSAREARSILDALSQGNRIRMIWDHEADASRAEVQLAFLALQCAEAALPRGGTLTVTLAPSRVEVSIQGERITRDPDVWRHLEAPAQAGGIMGEKITLSPAHVQFALLPLLASDRARRPAVTEDGAVLRITV